MKTRIIAFAAFAACVLGAGSAAAQRFISDQNSATSVGGLVDMWQQRINNENLPVADAKSWAARNRAKIARFSAERFKMAQRVTDLGELEAMLVTAPISGGTSLGRLMADAPGDVSFSALPKKDPGSDPADYTDLLFTVVNPCRLYDSRVSQGGTGPWLSGIARTVKVGPYSAAGGGYATGPGAQGGSATGCGLDTSASAPAVVAVLLAVSTVSQTAAGYLTFWSDTAPDPSASVVSLWYQPGYVQTSFIVAPTDALTPSWTSGISRGASTDVIIDIVGYFAIPHALALQCVEVYGSPIGVPANSTVCAPTPTCTAGYSPVAAVTQWNSGSKVAVLNVQADSSSSTFNACWGNTDVAAGSVTGGVRCCRVPGRN